MYELFSRKQYHDRLNYIISELKQQMPGDESFNDYRIKMIESLIKLDKKESLDDSITYYICHRIGDYDDPTPVLPIRTTLKDFFDNVLRDEQIIAELDDLVGGVPNILPYTMSDLEDNERVTVQNRHERMSIYQ